MLDSGPLVAALDPRDASHRRCAEAWPMLVDRCVTTQAVITEACHLVARGRASPALPVEFLLAAEIPIVGLDAQEHQHIAHLMRRYADLPMDYADATLVVLADAYRLETVFTLDRRGFLNYRRASGAGFQIVPER
ncbi:MAG: PIN domain-containing protein [Gemmatimonadaceae bacterium]|nr:PIN domain-containing protein [Gemmatimonadaceae bacterium]